MAPAEPEAPASEQPAENSDFILDLDTIQPVAIGSAEAEDSARAPVEDAAAQADAAPDIEDTQTAPAETEIERPAETPAAEEESPSNEPANTPTADTEPAPDEAPGSETVSPLQDYTCEDCVYVDTCPNRDVRLPKDCGSFQWR